MGLGREMRDEAIAESALHDMIVESREKRREIEGIKLKLLTVKDPDTREVLRDILNLIHRLM